MGEGLPERGRRRSRRLLLRILQGVLLLAIAMGALWAYLRWAGLPEFAKARLERSVSVRGVELQFERAQIRGWNKLVATHVRLAQRGPGPGPIVMIPRMEVDFGFGNRKQPPFGIRRILLQGAELLWSRSSRTNAEPLPFLSKVRLDLRFPNADRVEIVNSTAGFQGTDVALSGFLQHPWALKSWTWPRRAAAPKQPWPERFENWLSQASRFKIEAGSSMNLKVEGDARDERGLRISGEADVPAATGRGDSLENLHMQLSVQALQSDSSRLDLAGRLGRLETPWGHLEGADWRAQATGALTNLGLSQLLVQMQIKAFNSSALTGRDLAVSALTRPTQSAPDPFETQVRLGVSDLQSKFGTALTNHWEASLRHGTTLQMPWEMLWTNSIAGIQTRWGKLNSARLSGLTKPNQAPQQANSTWGPWARLEPWIFQWRAELQDLQSPKLAIDQLSVDGLWHAPNLTVSNIRAALYQGHLAADAQLHVPSRELRGRGNLDFDAHRISPLLTENSQRWLAQFSWSAPPLVTSAARLILPVWTDAHPRWREEVMPSIQLAGGFSAGSGGFRGVPVTEAHAHFFLTNLVWQLPDLQVTGTNLSALLAYEGHMGTHEFHWRVDAQVDPRCLRPLLPSTPAARLLNQLTVSKPPTVRGEAWGRWHDLSSLRFNGLLQATNFSFRGESGRWLSGHVALTNSTLVFTNVTIQHLDQGITIPSGSFDLTERVFEVTNAISTMDPAVITSVIGPKVYAALLPYRFDQPPTVRVNGRLPTFDLEDADVQFDVVGQSFRYWKLHATSIMGNVHWLGESLTITNVQANFYGGQLDWSGAFDFSVPVGARLQFTGAARGADLHLLMADLGRPTNQLAGALDARILVTGANSDDWRSWQGSGQVQLHDGFLWDIPIFGFFSPVLNTIVPGLGNSPISAGQATFQLSQSVVETQDLELRSSALRLDYGGTVDFEGNVDARMQAEILRDAWGVGRIVSFVLWPLSKAFEYKITGSIYHPKSEPVYIPKMLLWPLHPFRSLRHLLHLGQKPESQGPPGAGTLTSPSPAGFMNPSEAGTEQPSHEETLPPSP